VGDLRHYTTPARHHHDSPVLVLCHELPRTANAAAEAGPMYPTLADRLGAECGLRVAVTMLRGAGGSDGDFSARGWLEDLRFVVDHEVGHDGRAILAGFGLGTALALRLGVQEPRVCGVAAVAPAIDFRAFLGQPELLVAHCRATGVISSLDAPEDPDAWLNDLIELDPRGAAGSLGPRPLLVVHGTEDPEVPVAWAHSLAEAASGPSEFRAVPGGAHWLRADPRVVATLIGWTERQRYRST
jgi:uncharacterized protein